VTTLITGAIAAAFAVAALFFLRFWKETRDRLFAFFALSYLVLALNRAVIGLAIFQDNRGEYLYWIRLIAFVLILAAILDKNRSRPSASV
jgi:hypothetical protein